MFNLPGLPDLSKIQPMFEEALRTFKQLSADVEQIKARQEEIVRLLSADVEQIKAKQEEIVCLLKSDWAPPIGIAEKEDE